MVCYLRIQTIVIFHYIRTHKISWLYHTTFQKEISNLWYGRGVKNFGKGLLATLWRDVVFGAVYASSRHWNAFGWIDHENNHYDYQQEFVWNGFCALVATTASSPFNYIRNIQFATPPNEKPLSMLELSKVIIAGYKASNGLLEKFNFLQIRFKFGWGTLRVGLFYIDLFIINQPTHCFLHCLISI